MDFWRNKTIERKIMTKYDEIRKKLTKPNNKAKFRTLSINTGGQKIEDGKRNIFKVSIQNLECI